MVTLWVGLLALVALCGLAAWRDVLTGRIPNAISYSAIGVAALLATLPGGIGVRACVAGFLAAGALFFVFWIFQGVGAGDVKLQAAVGAFVGFPVVLDVLVFIALAGGLVGMLFLVWRKPTERMKIGRRLRTERAPFALATFIGVAVWTALDIGGHLGG